MDQALIARDLKEGRDYLPWLEIGDVPSLGRSHRLRGVKAGHVHHFLSDMEVALFCVLDWHDAVIDIREKFPLDRHTRVPLVMTTDFLVDFSIDGSTRLVAYAVKPATAAGIDARAPAGGFHPVPIPHGVPAQGSAHCGPGCPVSRSC
ncbi:MAG: hypothetical protein H7Z12_06065 [Rhodospirillaceae bacterium]|nr:hypothetical protein [Rhodospirillales bacterium]